MLNSETKRKIDSARNILVGNVTNPISQVDQITNALIYKFMDDMDQENLDVDLEAQFFVGDYAKYSWTKLLDKKLSGQERMNLYTQATESMSKNPHIPQLFRDIFKDAFLPYNDPRVLTLFLKEIDGFSYSHSEELGNAFEYLLSILGSQGDAGQFRTPRHIIDFIVDVVEPKKNETILDPACGTAGFLISAYKHILKAHDGIDNKTGKPTNKEKNLTPDEKTKLMNNVVGYDVDPGMVKLSLVNLYLHGFPDPKIHKYNTLADEKRWDEQFDVIMANPPFMTPKGGVETHKRFSIQASRSEVLFVDYIMDHLSIKGRAGIIVPEGIIFKGDKAYKALRKKLVEDGLFVVVSLPAGVFQPYSGVKTSILLFDNQVAKQTDEMLFVKIENDGFDLGAQRRPIEKNDLPKALELIQKYKESLKNKDVYLTGRDVRENNILLVSKSEIAESGDYNLTIDKYRKDPLEYLQSIINIKDIEKNIQPALDTVNKFVKSSAFLQLQNDLQKMTEQYKSLLENSQIKQAVALQKKFAEELKKKQKWDMVELGEIIDLNFGTRITKKDNQGTKYPVYGGGGESFRTDTFNRESELVISRFAMSEQCVRFVSEKFFLLDSGFTYVIKQDKSDELSKEFLDKVILSKQKEIYQCSRGHAQKNLDIKDFKQIKIPLPPLEVQKEIVEQIEVKQNAINHAKEIIKNLERERRYFGEELRKLEGVEWVELDEIANLVGGGTPSKSKANYWNNGIVKWISAKHINEDNEIVGYELITDEAVKDSTTSIIPKGAIIYVTRVSVGKVALADDDYAVNQDLTGVILKDNKIDVQFLFNFLRTQSEEIASRAQGLGVKGITRKEFGSYKIPLPPLEIQKQLVAETEKKEEIIASNRRLIELMERKIDEVLSDI